MIIVPIYNAEKVEFRFNTNPAVHFEPWNKQIERVSMYPDEREEIPDAVAIFEGEVDKNLALETLEKVGLNILPVIFEKAYYVYQVADEKNVFMRSSTSFSIFHDQSSSWIMPQRLQNFLDSATTTKENYDLRLALGTRYEADFRASSAQVKCFLYSLILEMLAEKFVDKVRESPLCEETSKEKKADDRYANFINTEAEKVSRNIQATPGVAPLLLVLAQQKTRKMLQRLSRITTKRKVERGKKKG